MSLQEQMMHQFREQQQKFVYYIVALSVTAIGFSVYKTTGSPLKCSQIPLGLAILCWGGSIAFGITFLRYTIAGIYNNYEYLNLLKGFDSQIGSDPARINHAAGVMKKIMDKNSDIASKYSKWQMRLFYSGVVSFLAWHILEMYLVSNPSFCGALAAILHNVHYS
jgi:hypothetical protein